MAEIQRILRFLSPTPPQRPLRYRATLVPYKLCRIPSPGFSDIRQTQSSITLTCLERLNNLARTIGPNILNITATPWLVPTFINE
jgi:hypothetical protein